MQATMEQSGAVAVGDAPRALELQLLGISKSYGAVQALDDVSMTVRGGEVVGLCGHNGAGKSTLMKVLTGLISPDCGVLRLDGEEVSFHHAKESQSHGITIVDQESGVVPSLSVTENLFLGNINESFLVRRRARRERARSLLQRVGLDVDPDALVRGLRPGERKLVEIAHALGREARLIILDEPTASLSYGEGRTVFAAVRDVVRQGAAVVFVSHRLDEVFEFCDRITVLRDGRHVASRNVDEFDRPTLVQMMVGEEGRELPVRVLHEAAGPPVRIVDLRVPPRVGRFSLEIEGGKIVGLAGQLGSGATEVLRGIAGLTRNASGAFVIGERATACGWAPDAARAGVRFLPGDRKNGGLFLGQSVESNLTLAKMSAFCHGGVVLPRVRRQVAQHLLDLVGVRASSMTQPVAALSGGNQQKVMLARLLDQKGGELLLLDDPTRGVDVHGRAEIHRLIRQAAAAGNTVLFVSTELDELLELADVIVTMYEGRIVAERPVIDTDRASILAEMTHDSSRSHSK
jgi:ABC-type sugar transport system ATPase subunit